MEQNHRQPEGHKQLMAPPPSHKQRFKFAAIAGAAAMALTLGACSNPSENATGDSAPTSTTTSASGEASQDNTTGGETQSVAVTSRPTTSLVDIPLDDDEAALELDNLPEIEEPELTSQEQAVADVVEKVENLTADQEPLEALTEVAKQTTTTAPPANAKRDGYTRNDSGQLVILDNPASLACADVEIGLSALDAGDIAAANSHVSSASTRAAASDNAAISSWSESLAKAAALEDDSVSVLVGFISVCAEGGYEI